MTNVETYHWPKPRSPTDIERIADDIAREDYIRINHLFTREDAAEPKIIWDPEPKQLEIQTHTRLLDYWNALRGDKEFPLARAIDPIDIEYALGYVLLIDVLDDGHDFQYRLYGSEIAMHYGRDMTGRLSSEIGGRIGTFFRAVYRAAILRREPVFTVHEPPRHVFVNVWRRLILPLADEGGEIVRFLVGNIPEDGIHRVGMPN